MFRTILYRKLFLFFAFLFPAIVSAEPVEELKEITCPECPVCPSEEAKDPSIWDKSLAFGFNMTDGNSNTVVTTMLGNLHRDFEKNIWDFSLAGSYGEADTADSNVKVKNRQDVRFIQDYKRVFGNEKYYFGWNSDFLYDDIAQVDYRLNIAPTIGYFLLKEDNLSFSVETGPGYIFEKVGGVKDDYFAPKVGERLDWTFSETGKLYHLAEYVFDTADSDNYLVRAEVGVESALSSLLSIVLAVKDRYDNQPAAGLEKNDLSIISAIKVNL